MGSYGWEEYPIVKINGEEYVAEECYISESGEQLDAVCQSRGCDYCSGYFSGCRYGENSGCQTAYVVVC